MGIILPSLAELKRNNTSVGKGKIQKTHEGEILGFRHRVLVDVGKGGMDADEPPEGQVG